MIFRRDPRWIGSDDAYSIALSADRILWLFGDTFIAGAGQERSGARFIRNSIAIQTGTNPSTAAIDFYWRHANDLPDSFFTSEAGVWLWPLHGLMLGDELLLFFMMVRSTRPDAGEMEAWREEGAVGFFDVFGWRALRVANPSDPPEKWAITEAGESADRLRTILGAGALAEDEHIHLYGWRDMPGLRQAYLTRATREQPLDLNRLEWWDGEGWTPNQEGARVLFDQAATEFTVHRRGSRLCLIQLVGLEDARFAIRWADRPEGPWTDPEPFFAPEEAGREGVILYAGKAHPELSGADLVLTYASNGTDIDITLGDDRIYYPRFVRMSFEGESA